MGEEPGAGESHSAERIPRWGIIFVRRGGARLTDCTLPLQSMSFDNDVTDQLDFYCVPVIGNHRRGLVGTTRRSVSLLWSPASTTHSRVANTKQARSDAEK